MARYVAIVDGKPGAFGVVIPDLPGCTSGGATIDEALRNAVEAVTLWVEDARADGERIPKPRSPEKLRGGGAKRLRYFNKRTRKRNNGYAIRGSYAARR